MPILAEEPSLFPPSLLAESDSLSERNMAWETRPGSSASEWWLVHTKARQEKSLARDLLRLEISFYLPLVRKNHMIRGRRVQSQLPLFAGYLFICGDASRRSETLATNRVAQIHRVADSQRLCQDLQQINRLIQSGVPLTVERKLAPGQRVRVRTGAFKGTVGTLVSRRGDTKLLVAVDFVGQGVSIEIDDFQLEPA